MDAAGLERIVSESNKEAKDTLERIRNNSEKNSRNRKRNSKNLIISGLIGASIFASYNKISYLAEKTFGFITEKAEAAAGYIDKNNPIYSIPEWLDKESSTAAEPQQYEEKRIITENNSDAEKKEAERIEAEKKEAERIAEEKREAEQAAAEKKEAEKIAAEKKEAARIAAEKKAALDRTQQKANFEKDLMKKFDYVFKVDDPSMQRYMPGMHKRFASKTEWIQLYCMLRAVDVLTSRQADSLATLVDGNLLNGELSDNPKFYMTIDQSAIYTELKSPYGNYFAKICIQFDGEDWDAFNKRCKRANTLLFGEN
jgi:hypothetical protein